MSFTYSVSALDTSLLYRIRFEMGDTVENQGIQPGSGNFADEEIQQLINEFGNDLYTVCAEMCDILATRWAGTPSFHTGPVSEQTRELYDYYLKRADEYRMKAGGYGVNGATSVGVRRADGYSVGIPSDATDYDDLDYGGTPWTQSGL